MGRLINADAFDERLVRIGALSIKRALDEEPTINPVHAAGGCYCRECEQYSNTNVRTGTRFDFHFCNKFGTVTKNTDFCSYGQKKENTTNDKK